MRGLSAKGRAGLRIVSAVLGLGILSGRMAPAEGAKPVTDHRVIILWPGGAPGAKGTDPEQDIPTLTAWLAKPEAATGAAVVVCPGGGYGMPAGDHEGRQVAEWLNSLGVPAFVLKYRFGPRYHHPAMLQDAGRAIRTVRALGQKWGVDPHRIAILGFSAGGHLASTAGTHFNAGKPDAEDPVERVSSRPDRLILVYPVSYPVAKDLRTGHRPVRKHRVKPCPLISSPGVPGAWVCLMFYLGGFASQNEIHPTPTLYQRSLNVSRHVRNHRHRSGRFSMPEGRGFPAKIT